MTPQTLEKTKVTIEAITEIYNLSIPDLIFKAQQVHREHHNANEIQFCTLSNIKAGACPEDCSYCSQSSRYNTGLEVEPLVDENQILKEAVAAKEAGSTRFCMGAAWREIPQGTPQKDAQFEQILNVVRKVKAMNMEPCVTLGMLNQEQALRLKEAGLHSYNHNIDTSREKYSEIISTRTFDDRLNTIANVQDAGINVCSGGILGLGETKEDRISMLETLINLDPQPSSVPINVLIPFKGTPAYDRYQKLIEEESKKTGENLKNKTGVEQADTSSILPIDKIELVRTVATARILIPKSRVRLSAGRLGFSEELQTLCFLAGANSIHTGGKYLTSANFENSEDEMLASKLGMSVSTTVEH